MKSTLTIVLMLSVIFSYGQKYQYQFAKIPKHKDSVYIDPFPKWVRDSLPKPVAYGKMKDLCFCFDLKKDFIMVGPDYETGCYEIWAKKDWDRLNSIWGEYNASGKFDRKWICTCNY